MAIRSNKTTDALGQDDYEWGNVPCRHGIHHINAPIAGMRVGDVRDLLTPILCLPPNAVVMANGRRLAEEDLIGEAVDCLTFTKPSSLTGGH